MSQLNDEEQKRLIILLQSQVIDLMEMVACGKTSPAKATKDEVFSVELQNQVVSLVEMITERDAKIETLEKQRTASSNDCLSVSASVIKKLEQDFQVVKNQKDKLATALKSLQEEFEINMSHEQKKVMEKNEFNIDEFKRVMTKATAENERLKAQNKELNDDIVEIQGLVGSFQESQQSNDSIIMQLKTLEEQNVRHSESIKEKNTLLGQFSERIEAMKAEASGKGAVTFEDMREVRLEFDQVSKRNSELEEQVEKYKIAVEAQKKYITGLTSAMDLSDQAREKMKEEIKALQAHRNQLQEQLTAHENLVGANSKREIQMEKYKNALEAKNTESGKILDTFKNQIVGLKKDRDTANEQVNANHKLIDSYKTQSNTMKQLINSYERENAHQKKENDLLLAKVGKLLDINQDLIKAREEDLEKRGPANDNENQTQSPKVVMQGTPESEAEFLKAQLANAALERDMEKYKTLNLKLRQENNIQSDQVEELNKKLLTAETLSMEKSEKIRTIEKKLAAGGTPEKSTPAPAPAEKDGPTTAEFMAMK